MKYVRDRYRKPVAVWLFTVAALIFCMILLGGLTRLTESGLSMVDWRPLMGTIPPLNEAEWMEVFHQYQQYPEYRLKNIGMTLSEFKFIFFMEYGHRVLGRTIGLAFFLPFAFFLFKRVFKGKTLLKLTVLFFLGGMQGVIGWYMVKSGLVDVPRVSQYRLVLHLSMAILVFSLCLWYGFDTLTRNKPTDPSTLLKMRPVLLLSTLLTGLQITGGGFVAGLDAGKLHTTWGVPAGLSMPGGIVRNFFENPILVLFLHRNFAIIVAGVLLALFFHYRTRLQDPLLKGCLHLMALTVVIQVCLGVGTVLLRVPVSLASAHQGVALILWGCLLFMAHRTHLAMHGEQNLMETAETA